MRWTRRDWLRTVGLGMAAAMAPGARAAEDAPIPHRPRATSGDTVSTPTWIESLTVTVGNKEGDLIGATDRVIQAAVDYAADRGGGTVQLAPGEYRLRNAIFLKPQVRLRGGGPETVLIKEASVETTLAEDSDWYDQEITLANPDGFRVGDGVCLITEDPSTKAREVVKRTLIARSGDRFKLDKALRRNYWRETKPLVATLFPMLTAEEAEDLVIENLTLDGNRANNGHLDGNYAGCIWLQDCRRVRIHGVTARSYNGDGISWQICHDVSVEECRSEDHAGLGLHPGSGSQRSIIRNNTLDRNNTGLFFCWGVKCGLAENNTLTDNREYGISIGHRDDENIIRKNTVLRSGKAGLIFRPERGEGYTARGNLIEGNTFTDTGADGGVAIDIQGVTSGNSILRNHIEDSRKSEKSIGVQIGADTGANRIEANTFSGIAVPLRDLRTGTA